MMRKSMNRGIISACALAICLMSVFAVSGCGAASTSDASPSSAEVYETISASSDSREASGSAAESSEASESASNSPDSWEATGAVGDSSSDQIESESDAVNLVHDCLMRAGKQVPTRIECDQVTDDGRYLIHGYDVVEDSGQQGADLDSKDEGVFAHTATAFWYSVGRDGSIYDEIFMCDIDPVTMEAVQASSSPSNDYYEINLPSELSDAEITYEEGSFGGPTTAGAISGVRLDEWLLFEVVVLSDDWGPQGDMEILELGRPSASSSSVVYLTVPLQNADGSRVEHADALAKAKEYADYVTVL